MAQTNTAARDYWNGLMQKHQGVNFFLTILASIVGYLLAGVRYIFSGHWFVDLAKQIIIVGGRIATSVLFFAALWIAGRSTEPAFMGHLVSSLPALHLDPANLDSSAILAFTLLPEVILLGVLVLTIDLWVSVARERRNGLAWIWASLYSLFAGIFMYIGIYTFCSFISTGHVPTTNTSVDGMVLFRALTGWLYALVEMVHAGVSHRYHAPAQQQAATQVPALDVNALITEAIADLQTKFEQSLNVIVAEQTQTRTAIQQIQSAPATIPAIDYEAIVRAIMPQLRATFQSQSRTITEEVQSHVKAMLIESQSHQPRPLSGPKPGPQLEARATFQSQGQSHNGQPALKLVNGSRPETETGARANGTPEERLQAAYEVLTESNQRMSGRALAKLAHVNRAVASSWLGEVKGQKDDDSEPFVDATCEVEAIAQGQ
jgi:hypothetical protein